MRYLRSIVPAALALAAGIASAEDFNGDGTGDVAIFRDSSGLWGVRGVTQFYFGGAGDLPKPGDYSGNGTDTPAVFRATAGLWAVRGVTRVYFGASGDKPKPGDYNGDGTEDIGIFREDAGLWAARGITRFYFGAAGDKALAPDVAYGELRTSGLLRTGQTTIYYSGDDGAYQAGRRFFYTDHGDGTVTDNVTGLMWPTDGTGAGCFNGQTATWAEALDYCNTLTFAEHNDWRLPNVRELLSLADYGRTTPCLDTGIFINTIVGYHWTSTPDDSGTSAWSVHFYDGDLHVWNKTVYGLYVRPVRGGI
ncbi:MAG TPA: DUF1566 domain-containing protein [bacterium]|nr:DUF1566 domain-containing protein [bacterium]HPQ66416.1 DUF1566 domain-containing protein [bacterium]